MPSTPPLSSSSSSNSSHSEWWFPYRKSADFDTNLAMIVIILFCSLTGVLALNAAIRCLFRRRDSAPSLLPDDQVSKPPQVVVAIPSMEFSSWVKLAGAGAECAICLSEFASGEVLRVLPKCKHGFHEKCIEAWLSSGSSCPTCRTSFLVTSSPEKEVAVQSEVELLPGRMTEP